MIDLASRTITFPVRIVRTMLVLRMTIYNCLCDNLLLLLFNEVNFLLIRIKLTLFAIVINLPSDCLLF